MYAVNDEKRNFNTELDKLKNIGITLKDKIAVEIYNEYKEIFDKIRKKISNNEEKAQKFIKDLKNHYKIENGEFDKLAILLKSKNYEKDINSIIFFFDYFEEFNSDWNSKLSKEKYKNLSENTFEEIITKLVKR